MKDEKKEPEFLIIKGNFDVPLELRFIKGKVGFDYDYFERRFQEKMAQITEELSQETGLEALGDIQSKLIKITGTLSGMLSEISKLLKYLSAIEEGRKK